MSVIDNFNTCRPRAIASSGNQGSLDHVQR
jgi:hypothetical protein